MNTKRLAAALGFALICSGFFTLELSRHMPRAAVTSGPPLRRIVIAAKDLTPGEVPSSASVSTVSTPTAQTIGGLFSSPQDLTGRVLLVPVASGEAITLHELADAKAKTELEAMIPDDMRVVSLAAADPGANVSLATPRSRVDLLVSYRSDTEAAFVSSVILQNVLVLKPTQKPSTASETRTATPDSINLLVTPEEAARFTVASAAGKLTVALRNGTDNGMRLGLDHVTLTRSQKNAFAPTSSASVASSRADTRRSSKDFVIETLSGGKSTIQTFPEGAQ